MRETKELLLKLQELDDQIDRLKAEEESIPEKKTDLEEGLEAHKGTVEAAKNESVELAKKRKELEIELEEGNTKNQTATFPLKTGDHELRWTFGLFASFGSDKRAALVGILQ